MARRRERPARVSLPAQLSLPWRECGDVPHDTPVAPPTVVLPPPVFVRNGRARRYILRVLPDASTSATYTPARVLSGLIT